MSYVLGEDSHAILNLVDTPETFEYFGEFLQEPSSVYKYSKAEWLYLNGTVVRVICLSSSKYVLFDRVDSLGFYNREYSENGILVPFIFKTTDQFSSLMKDKNIFIAWVRPRTFKTYRKEISFEPYKPISWVKGLQEVIDFADLFTSVYYNILENNAKGVVDTVPVENNVKIQQHGFDLKTSFRSNRV